MRKEYDFSKARKNPYSKMLKQQVTIRLESETVDYFKKLSQSEGIPYQNLINMYLRDCVQAGRKPVLKWA
jgi:predicted DNA binding CopG/RHH family protein